MQPACPRVRSTAPRPLHLAHWGLLLLAPLASAGNLQVAPILLEFGEGVQAQALWLENSGDQPLHAQVRIQRWTQSNSADVLEPSQMLLARPAIVQIGPGQRQLVRVLRPAPFSAGDTQEQAYRLLVDELPATHVKPNQGLNFLLRYSIPAFVLPAGASPREPGSKAAADTSGLHARWQLDPGLLTLTVHNTGAQRVRLSQLRWLPENGPPIELTPGLLGYVLAGQHMQWTLPLPRPFPLTGTLQARLNDAAIPQPLRPADL
jgi:fimbrial chaperone protein